MIVPIQTFVVDGCNRFSFQLLCTFQVDMLGIVLIKSKLLLVLYLYQKKMVVSTIKMKTDKILKVFCYRMIC